MPEVVDKDQAIADVLEFWRQSGKDWFSHSPRFDREFGDRFAALHDEACDGALADWETTPDGCLALLILLDQYPRHAFRGTARMYQTDADARRIARRMVYFGFVSEVVEDLQLFCLLPFAHSEDDADQALSVRLHEAFLPSGLDRARRHQAIVERFGRFPHRNAVLGRPSRPDEHCYLADGGFQG